MMRVDKENYSSNSQRGLSVLGYPSKYQKVLQ